MNEAVTSVIQDNTNRNSSNNTTKILLVFILISILGTFLRLYKINQNSLNLDEAQSIWQASHSVQFIENYTAQNVHLPLHNLMLHVWMKLFGYSEYSVRILSALFGVLVFPAMYLLAYEIFRDRFKALFTLFISAISPFWIWYSREIRMYSLLALVTVLSYYFYLRLLNKISKINIFLYILTNILGIYTHFFFGFVLLIQGLFLLISWKAHWYTEVRHNTRRIFTTFILSSLALVITLIPWAIFHFNAYAGGTIAPHLTKPTTFNIVLSLFQFTFGYQPDLVTTIIIAAWPLICLLVFIFLTKRTMLLQPNIYLAFIGAFLPIILVYLLSVFTLPMFLSRYLIISSPLYIIFFSWVLLELKGYPKYIIITLTIISFAYALSSQNNRVDITEKENYKAAVAYVNSIATPQDVVMVAPSYTLFPVQYYYNSLAKLTTLPIWNRTQLNLPASTPQNLLNDAEYLRAGHKRMIFIDTLNLQGGYDVQNFLDHKYTRLEAKQFSYYIWVYVYQADYSALSANISNSVNTP